MDQDKVISYLQDMAEDVHPEVIRFIEDFMMKIEFGQFEMEEGEEA